MPLLGSQCAQLPGELSRWPEKPGPPHCGARWDSPDIFAVKTGWEWKPAATWRETGTVRGALWLQGDPNTTCGSRGHCSYCLNHQSIHRGIWALGSRPTQPRMCDPSHHLMSEPPTPTPGSLPLMWGRHLGRGSQ